MSEYLPDQDGGDTDEELFEAPEETPFSFKLMVVLGTLYVAWRLVELVLCGAELVGWGTLGPDWCS